MSQSDLRQPDSYPCRGSADSGLTFSAPSPGRRLRRRRFLLEVLTLAGVNPLSKKKSQRSAAPTTDDFITFFDTLALLTTSETGSLQPHWVRKWTGPVAVLVIGSPPPRIIADLQAILRRISNLTKLDFHLAKRLVRSENHMTIRFDVPRPTIWQHSADGAFCDSWTIGKGGRIRAGWIEVSSGYADCLCHELMHVLGFDNHWDGPRATPRMLSILAPRYAPARADHFTQWDERAIRLLYDSRLKPGMSRPAALRVVRDIARKHIPAKLRN